MGILGGFEGSPSVGPGDMDSNRGACHSASKPNKVWPGVVICSLAHVDQWPEADLWFTTLNGTASDIKFVQKHDPVNKIESADDLVPWAMTQQ